MLELLLIAQISLWDPCVYYQTRFLLPDGRKAQYIIQVERTERSGCPELDQCAWVDSNWDGIISAPDYTTLSVCFGVGPTPDLVAPE